MAIGNFEIVSNHCNCHPETCSCDDWNLTYKGEVLARHLRKEKLEKLLQAIVKEQDKAIKKERKRIEKGLFKALDVRWGDKFDY